MANRFPFLSVSCVSPSPFRSHRSSADHLTSPPRTINSSFERVCNAENEINCIQSTMQDASGRFRFELFESGLTESLYSSDMEKLANALRQPVTF